MPNSTFKPHFYWEWECKINSILGQNLLAPQYFSVIISLWFQEERLREEAAKRLERRRKKMLSPEERLARLFSSFVVNFWHFNFKLNLIEFQT